jgi:ribose transport system ATP-binding protein
MGDIVLRATGIGKQFGPVKALDDVHFELERGEIHALLGVNGAGKSTLVKILSGVYVKDSGTIEINGRKVEFSTPRDAIDNGIAAVQQHPELVPGLTGFENIYLGREQAGMRLFRRFDRNALRKRAGELLRRLPIDIDLDCVVRGLASVDREVIAVLHALTRDDIAVLILDEPTSILTEVEKTSLFRLMRALKAAGIAVIYITHRLEEVFEIADRFTIFRGGRNVGTLRSGEAALSGLSIAEAMLGEKTGELYPPRTGTPGQTLLEAHALSQAGAFEAVSFEARRGEVLGIFGLVGSGMDELSKVLFGISAPTGGTISLFGKKIVLKGPRDALRQGIFLVPGDRRSEGLTLTRDVTFNMTLANLGRASGFGGYMKSSANRKASKTLATQVALIPPNLARDVQTFSGGNQQKIVIAKGLYSEAEIYIFVEPTIGVDIAARAKVYALIRDLAAKAAVILMSSDCDEVCGLADRVIALYKGRITYGAPAGASARDELLMAGIMGSPDATSQQAARA